MDNMELKPCPFCGGEAEVYEAAGGWMAACKAENACVQSIVRVGWWRTEAKAIAAWNRRPPAPGSVGARVKPLVWKAVAKWRWVATSILGSYVVEEVIGKPDKWNWYLTHVVISDTVYDTPDEAKAACFADWQSRILSALEPDTARDRALEEADWQLDAFDATLLLAESREMHALRLPSGLDFAHLRDMRSSILPDFSRAKLGRWLGWAQAAVVAANCATLDEMKAINKAASEVRALRSAPAPEPVDDEATGELAPVSALDNAHSWRIPIKLPAPEDGWRVPEGWQLVPKEPTAEQRAAAWQQHGITFPNADAAYRAMLAAAPNPPSQGGE